MIRLLIIMMLACSSAYAHKLNIMAEVKEDSMTVNAFFADGKPCQDCALSVSDNFGKTVIEGRLDSDGAFFQSGSFPDDVIVTVDAGLGHMATEKLSKTVTENINEGTASSGEDVRQIVRQEMAKQTAELKAEIAKSRSNIDKIIAGIGYILGIFGLIILLRKK